MNEPDRIAWRPILRVTAIAIAIATAAVAWSTAMQRRAGPSPEHEAGLAGRSPLTGGAIDLDGAARPRAAGQRHRLETYGWVDREHGVASIPIDDAIEAWLQVADKQR